MKELRVDGRVINFIMEVGYPSEGEQKVDQELGAHYFTVWVSRGEALEDPRHTIEKLQAPILSFTAPAATCGDNPAISNLFGFSRLSITGPPFSV